MRADKQKFQSLAVVLCLVGIGIAVWAAQARTGGFLVYTLDDPYIHLAVAESLLQGTYGVNVGEYASPSSSILYPFLLAALLAAGFGDLGPLVINIIGSCVAAWLIAGVFWSHAVDQGSRRQVFGAIACLPLLLLALNLIGLPLTGMEHTLHVMASVGVIVALYELERGRAASFWLVLCVLLTPMLRFEGVALAGAALIALLFLRRFGLFVVASAGLIAVFGAYVVFMARNGLPVLPSSVLTKSAVSSAAVDRNVLDVVKGIVRSVIAALEVRGGALLGIAFAMLVLSVSVSARSNKVPWLTLFVAGSGIAAHIAAGQYGWFSRYEIYAVAIAFVGLLIGWSPLLRHPTERPFFKFAGIFALLGVIAGPYAFTLFRTPAASENIYAQQYQMHRFAVDYFPQRVAVNDLGYVSYQNDGHVLDLWGLGSEAARKVNAAGAMDAQNMARLTADAGSVYAMVYQDWFPGAIPPEWCQIAVLNTPLVTVARDKVDFYLIDPSFGPEMAQALSDFAPTLPPMSSLDQFSCS